jgi:hypothetical protein
VEEFYSGKCAVSLKTFIKKNEVKNRLFFVYSHAIDESIAAGAISSYIIFIISSSSSCSAALRTKVESIRSQIAAEKKVP